MKDDERPNLSEASLEDLRIMVESPSERDQLDALMELTDRAYGPVPEENTHVADGNSIARNAFSI
jgi:hypothetical protein